MQEQRHEGCGAESWGSSEHRHAIVVVVTKVRDAARSLETQNRQPNVCPQCHLGDGLSGLFERIRYEDEPDLQTSQYAHADHPGTNAEGRRREKLGIAWPRFSQLSGAASGVIVAIYFHEGSRKHDATFTQP